MRMFSILSAVLVSAVLVGCSSTQDVSAGAMGSKGECCAASSECCKEAAAPGAVSEGCASKCTKTDAAPGAISEGCASKCTKTEAAPGAVSDGCASKCTKSDAAPGAMSEPKTCPMSGCSSKSSCGNKTSE